MPNPQGRCIFCDRFGLTHEHIWADWLRPHLTRLSDQHKTAIELHHPDGSTELKLKKQSGDPRRRSVRCVCRPCNNEWMSQLQESGKATLLSIMASDPIRLNRRQQTLLSSWSAMLAMTAEYTQKTHVAISKSDREWLMKSGKAPSHWRIWIAHFPSDDSCDQEYVHCALELPEKNAIQTGHTNARLSPNTQTTAFRIGHALIHLMSSSAVIAHGAGQAAKIGWPARAREMA
jgi:hypothetical protein